MKKLLVVVMTIVVGQYLWNGIIFFQKPSRMQMIIGKVMTREIHIRMNIGMLMIQ